MVLLAMPLALGVLSLLSFALYYYSANHPPYAYTDVIAAGPVLAFTRTWEDETVLCAANAGPAPAELELPGGETRTLGPWEGRLLRLEACQAAEDVLSERGF